MTTDTDSMSQLPVRSRMRQNHRTPMPLQWARFTSAALLVTLAGTAQATITLYSSPILFANAAGTLSTDTFNDLPAGQLLSSPLNRGVGSASYSAAVEPDTSGFSVGAVIPPGQFFVAGSTADAWLSTNTATDTLRFSSAGGFKAIGGAFFGSDVDGLFLPGVDILLEATDGSGVFSHTLTSATLAGFTGLVSDGKLLSLTLRALQPAAGNAWLSANNLQFAQAVPEPGSAALALLALALLGTAARIKPGRSAG